MRAKMLSCSCTCIAVGRMEYCTGSSHLTACINDTSVCSSDSFTQVTRMHSAAFSQQHTQLHMQHLCCRHCSSSETTKWLPQTRGV